MNEPGCERDSRTQVVQLAAATSLGAVAYVTYGASIPPTWGVTVGVRELLDTDETWLVVIGSHKAEVLR